jgi:hypothetical protein
VASFGDIVDGALLRGTLDGIRATLKSADVQTKCIKHGVGAPNMGPVNRSLIH